MADTTSTSVSPFNFGTHAVRVVMQDGTPWFVANDVCTALGYINTSKAIGDHLDDDERSTVTNSESRNGGGKLVIINESGLYALVLRSRKPEARKFAKWVTSEVLPAIRKTGSYELPNLYRQQPGDKLASHQQLALRAVLEGNATRLPHEKQAGFMMRGWSKLKAHFGVPYREIPAQRFEEALSLLMRHVAEYTEPQPIETPSLKSRRWLISFDHQGNEVVEPIAWDYSLLRYQDLPRLLGAPDNRVPSNLLFDIATTCMQRLQNEQRARS